MVNNPLIQIRKVYVTKDMPSIWGGINNSL